MDSDWFVKLLKLKTFISQKSLDTPVFRLIRFRQKVLTESKPPLELFSLEEEAAQLPGGLFVLAISSGARNSSAMFSYYLMGILFEASESKGAKPCSAMDAAL